MKKFFVFLPLMALLSIANPLSAEVMCTMEYAMMINEKTQECREARNGCIIHDLMEEGYRRAAEGECDQKKFSSYVSYCTMEFAYMINDDTGECRVGRNGCIIQDLINKGFRRAAEEECALDY